MIYDVVNDDRLPAGTRLGAVTLRVTDLQRSLAFYRDLLGLQIVAESSSSSSLATAPGMAPLLVLLDDSDAVPHPARTLGLYHLALRLPERLDLARLVHRLLRRRWRLQGASDHAVSEAVYLTDPDGNGIELYVDRPRELWRWEGAEVVMRTMPLDLAGLLLDFRDELDNWRGLPPDTVVGHIHLHVSELEGAESFYGDLLGFAVTTRSFPGSLFFGAGGYHHHIGVDTWAGPVASSPQKTAGLVSFEVIIPNPGALEGIYLDAVRRGHAISANGNGWQIRDQDGNLVILRGE